jgi:translation initiation factor 2 subunit 1
VSFISQEMIRLHLPDSSFTGYIDLSKRRVSPDDVMKCEERYNKSKAVQTIMSHIAGKLNKDIEQLYETIAWPLDKKYGHAYDAFKVAVS